MLIGLVVLVALLGLAALYLHQPGRGSGLARPATVAFVLLLSLTLGLSVALWEPATAVSVSPVRAASLSRVLALVKASDNITKIPANLQPPVVAAVQSPQSNIGNPPPECVAGTSASTVPSCVFGDTNATRTVLLYGDSHAGMWFQALNRDARHDRWRLVVLFKGGCPASFVSVHFPDGSAGDFKSCDAWHTYVRQRINAINPQLLIVTQERNQRPDNTLYTPQQWKTALIHTLKDLHAGRVVVLGDIPINPGPGCLARLAVINCYRRPGYIIAPYNNADKEAAKSVGASYVDTTPWFCAERCGPIIGHFDVYWNAFHVALGYSMFLRRVLGKAVGV